MYRASNNSLQLSDDYVANILKWCVNRVDRLEDLVSNQLLFLWVSPGTASDASKDKLLIAEKLKGAIQTNDNFTKEALKGFLKAFAQENQVHFSVCMKLLRSILSGLKVCESMEK